MVELPWIETCERVLSGSSVTRYGHVVDRALDGTRWQVIVWVSFADFWVSFADFWVSFADFWACERVLERIVGWVLGRTVGAGKG